jgi:hypothetical protein
MSPINIPPDGKGPIVLACQACIMGVYRECIIEDADAAAQVVHVRLKGSLFCIMVPFRDVQNIALKHTSGEVLQNFGAPRLSNPASLAFIQYQSVQS